MLFVRLQYRDSGCLSACAGDRVICPWGVECVSEAMYWVCCCV